MQIHNRFSSSYAVMGALEPLTKLAIVWYRLERARGLSHSHTKNSSLITRQKSETVSIWAWNTIVHLIHEEQMGFPRLIYHGIKKVVGTRSPMHTFVSHVI